MCLSGETVSLTPVDGGRLSEGLRSRNDGQARRQPRQTSPSGVLSRGGGNRGASHQVKSNTSTFKQRRSCTASPQKPKEATKLWIFIRKPINRHDACVSRRGRQSICCSAVNRREWRGGPCRARRRRSRVVPTIVRSEAADARQSCHAGTQPGTQILKPSIHDPGHFLSYFS